MRKSINIIVKNGIDFDDLHIMLISLGKRAGPLYVEVLAGPPQVYLDEKVVSMSWIGPDNSQIDLVQQRQCGFIYISASADNENFLQKITNTFSKIPQKSVKQLRKQVSGTERACSLLALSLTGIEYEVTIFNEIKKLDFSIEDEFWHFLEICSNLSWVQLIPLLESFQTADADNRASNAIDLVLSAIRMHRIS